MNLERMQSSELQDLSKKIQEEIFKRTKEEEIKSLESKIERVKKSELSDIQNFAEEIEGEFDRYLNR